MEEIGLEKIPLSQWRKYAVGDSEQGYKTDEFYCQLANDIYEILRPACGVKILPSAEMHVLCIRLSQYVEDYVSDLGIFNTFLELDKSFGVHGLKDTANGDNSLKVGDIQFLIWDFVMAFTSSRKKPSISNPDYERLAKELKIIMDEAFKSAPSNTELYNWIYPEEKFTSFIEIIERLLWLNRCCYVTASYTYDGDLSYLRNLGGRIEADEGDEYRWLFKFTPIQSKQYFSEVLMFQKTTRLLSASFTFFYSQMLKNKGEQTNSTLAANVEAIFQKFKVVAVEDNKMLLQALDSQEYLVDIPEQFRENVSDPSNVGFIVASLIKFEGHWHLWTCRKFAYARDCAETGEDYFRLNMRAKYERARGKKKI